MAGYKIYQSSSLEYLVENYSSTLIPHSLFGKELCLVVQNQGMGEWLKLRLASLRGVSGDNPYILPEKALRSLAGGYPAARELLEPAEGKIYYIDNLKVRIYKILEQIFSSLPNQIPSEYQSLYNYISPLESVKDQDRVQLRTSRLFGLADSIAGLFSHYSMNCLPLVEFWESGKPYPGVPLSLRNHERWQRSLWKRVFAEGLSLSQVLKALEGAEEAYQGEYQRVVLFGSSFLGDRALQFFHRLSQDIEVHHFILTPSRVYCHYPAGELNPLLKDWCTQMAGFNRLADQFSGASRTLHFPPLQGRGLLGLVQRGIIENQPRPFWEPERTEDPSIQLYGCMSPWREVEVLKDLILDALNRDSTLRLTDIAILAPDINDYAPYLEALFSSQDPRLSLPCNFIDLDNTALSPLTQGFLHLLTLPGGRFGRTELFNLFDNPCFREALGISRGQRQAWLELCQDLHIKWGYDGTHKSHFVPGSGDFNTWERGFKRVLEGLFLEEEDAPSLPYPAPDEERAFLWGALIELVQGLFNDLWELDKLSMTLEQWVFVGESLLRTYFKSRGGRGEDERDYFTIKRAFRDINNLASETIFPGTREFNFYVFRALLREFIGRSSGQRGRYLSSGISCSSIKPMRAIPFRRIYLLGMNEGAFPSQEIPFSFDLRDCVPQSIDLSRRGGERYAFLESVLSAQESISFFYQDRDPIRGETLEPSILVRELLDYLEDCSEEEGVEGGGSLLVRESIHNFDPRYFDGRRRSYNPRALESARIEAQGGAREERPLFSLCRPSPQERECRFEELLFFLRDPVKWYFRTVLGIYLGEESPEEDSQDNLLLPFLEKWTYYNSRLGALESLGEPGKLTDYMEKQKRRGALYEGDIAFLEEEEMAKRLEGMARQAQPLREKIFYQILLDHQGGEQKESGFEEKSFLPLELVTLGGTPLLFRGTLRAVTLQGGGEEETLEYCEAGTPGAKQSLEGFLKFLFLAELFPDFHSLRLLRIGKRPYPALVYSSRGRAEKGRVWIPDPAQTLRRLLNLYRAEDILPLSPEMGQRMASQLAGKALSNEELRRAWENLWMEGEDGFEGAGGCPYRNTFLTSPPSVSPEALWELLELLYLPLYYAGKGC